MAGSYLISTSADLLWEILHQTTSFLPPAAVTCLRFFGMRSRRRTRIPSAVYHGVRYIGASRTRYDVSASLAIHLFNPLMSGSPTVVIVGGGNAGLCTYNVLASKLAATPMKLILVTPNTYYTHLPASARLVVTKEGKLEEKAFAPYTARFREGNNSLVHAKVTSIVDDDDRGRYVTLDNGENIDYSALILTPGCIWEGALEFSEMIGQEALASVYSWRDRFENAQDIVLVGGGGVGIGEHHHIDCLHVD